MGPEERRVEPRDEKRDELFRKLRERILSTLSRRFGGARAEDLTQDIMMILIQKYSHLEEGEILDKVASTIMGFIKLAENRRISKEASRAGADDPELVIRSDDPPIDVLLIRRERLKELESGISQLKQRCRKLAALRLEGKTTAEAAADLQISPGATDKAWHDCLKRLREIMMSRRGGGRS